MSGRIALTALACLATLGVAPPAAAQDRQSVLEAMRRATTFMVEEVSTGGGYVWAYLPDLSRRWGELEARDTMIWIQPPGTATMGHLFLDAYHATGDEFYYRAAERVAGALARAQLPSGGWNYFADFAGDASRRDWYDTVGRNAWRLEEFQHDWCNATFDDGGTVEAATFLLRLHVEKGDPAHRVPLDRAIRFVIESQYPIGAWPQRFPPPADGHGLPEYPGYLTFNDDVAGGNIEFLIRCYEALARPELLDPIRRGMFAFILTQGGPPQPGWALQYTADLRPAAARTYEPAALATHTTATNIERLVEFYRLTGDTRFLARLPAALDWLETLRLPPGVAPAGRTHPTFVELGTNRPLYVHRIGSNVVNGRYFVDGDAANTIGHYSSFRFVDVTALRALYEQARAEDPDTLRQHSLLAPGRDPRRLPRYTVVGAGRPGEPTAAAVLADLDARGRWITGLGTNSHPYRGPGPATPAPGDFARTHVGDAHDTSPFPDDTLRGISTAAYLRNMSVLIRYLDTTGDRPARD